LEYRIIKPMATLNTPPTYLPYYKNQKENNCRTILKATTSAIPLFVEIPSRVTGAYFGPSPMTRNIPRGSDPRNQEKVRKIYRHLSLKSRKKLSCGNNENIRALLGYLRKKRRAENSSELPARRRRSFPKQSKRSSKRSTKSQL